MMDSVDGVDRVPTARLVPAEDRDQIARVSVPYLCWKRAKGGLAERHHEGVRAVVLIADESEGCDLDFDVLAGA